MKRDWNRSWDGIERRETGMEKKEETGMKMNSKTEMETNSKARIEMNKEVLSSEEEQRN